MIKYIIFSKIILLDIIFYNLLWWDNCYRTHQGIRGRVSRKILKYTVCEMLGK